MTDARGRIHDQVPGDPADGVRGQGWLPDEFGSVLLGLRPLIPRALLDGVPWERMLDRIGALPRSAAEHACVFECRLGDPEPAADVTVPVLPGSPMERYLVRLDEGTPSRTASALVRHLVQRGASTPGPTNGTLIEYDIAGLEPGEQRVPGVHLRVRSGVGAQRRGSGDGAVGALVAMLADVAGWPHDEAERRAVERAFCALPAGARIIQSGVMPERRPRAIRLVVKDIATRDLRAFLDRLGWAGDYHAVAATLSGLLDVFSYFWVAFDVTARGAGRRLGLELFPRGSGEFTRCDPWLKTVRRDWRPIVDRLRAANLCLPSKAEGMLAWPGLERVFEQERVCFLYKGINHVKIVIDGDAIQAKAYPAMRYAPMTAHARVRTGPDRTASRAGMQP